MGVRVTMRTTGPRSRHDMPRYVTRMGRWRGARRHASGATMWVQLGPHSGPEKPRQGGHAGRVRVGLRKSNSRNSRACNLGGPCVARQLRPRDWGGPAGPPPWLHAQRACGHFEPSEPLWVQLLQKPRACQYKGVCMGFANVQVSFKKHSPRCFDFQAARKGLCCCILLYFAHT